MRLPLDGGGVGDRYRIVESGLGEHDAGIIPDPRHR
ncbi:hypothetical protein RLDS_21565 [Sphingobium lactosutens DS20]|uniref:Uncharacterized protein n=1 Tax=Sphingobium lactosutens DS20 TaxID=1331060 RepID=T0HFD2_9SPHN|nr:hypothetical protein RLDS_21565 [Sphingobium lactosutens DS20]